MKILIVTPFITTNAAFGNFVHSGGGVAVRYENYEKQLKLAGHETRVLCPNRRTVDTWVLKDDGYITASCMKGFPMNGLTISNLRRLVHCFRWCDVCVCPETEHMMTLALFSKIFKTRLVMNVHTNVHQMLASSPYLRPLANFTYHSFLKAALCSSRVKCYTVSETNKKVLESNGVDVSGVYELSTKQDVVEGFTAEDREKLRSQLAPGIGRSYKIILFAGRWLEEKRIHRLVETLPPSAALVIVGDGPLNITKHHSPKDRVFVHKGFLPNDRIYECFAAVDWVANPSDFETFGNTSYEANSVGVPCILHPKGGHLSQIEEEGTNGYFVDFDMPDADVTARLESFINSPPSSESVKRGMVRKKDAVTILDVVSPSCHIRKPHETPFAGACGPARRAYLVGRWLVSETLLKFVVLSLGFLFNLLVVSSVSVLGGVTPIKADSYQDRLLRVRLKRKRKRDMVKAFLKSGVKNDLESFPFFGAWGKAGRDGNGNVDERSRKQ
eukprot:CAMPEP_0182474960 /NCGR_PEP_ID=MMETSP1319-20130603/26555_1 /TAXON_ID=172717 /ORGANISM="Bolidomonas pacifica, Strain RCC208" /LENGTH=498 /DNA_ID=CAMNT_0024675905 /DNA_START=8 /DNA_END=1504 /DNA_ORIENTATION=+